MPNSTVSSTNTEITWTDDQVQALVADLKIEKNEAIDKAVQEATAPLIADLYAVNIELDFYKENWTTVEEIISGYKIETDKLRAIIIFGGIGITVLAGLAGYGLAHIF